MAPYLALSEGRVHTEWTTKGIEKFPTWWDSGYIQKVFLFLSIKSLSILSLFFPLVYFVFISSLIFLKCKLSESWSYTLNKYFLSTSYGARYPTEYQLLFTDLSLEQYLAYNVSKYLSNLTVTLL